MKKERKKKEREREREREKVAATLKLGKSQTIISSPFIFIMFCSSSSSLWFRPFPSVVCALLLLLLLLLFFCTLKFVMFESRDGKVGKTFLCVCWLLALLNRVQRVDLRPSYDASRCQILTLDQFFINFISSFFSLFCEFFPSSPLPFLPSGDVSISSWFNWVFIGDLCCVLNMLNSGDVCCYCCCCCCCSGGGC